MWFSTVGLLAVVGLFVGGVIAYMDAVNWVDHTLAVRAQVDQWLFEVHQLETEARNRLEIKDAVANDFEAAILAQRESGTRLAKLVADNPKQVQSVEAAQAAVEAIVQLLRNPSVSQFEGGADANREPNSTTRLLDALLTAGDRFEERCHELQQRESELLVARGSLAKRRVLTSLTAGALLGAIAFGLLIVVWSSRAQREASLRRAATDASQRLRTLSDVAVALSNARTLHDVAQVVVEIGMHAVNADTCTIYVLDETRTKLKLIGDRGVSPSLIDKLREVSADEGNPVTFHTLSSGTSLWVEDLAQYEKLMPEIARMNVEGPRARAFWSVPLIVEGSPLGLLGMGFYTPRQFSDEDRVLVDTLSKHCAQGLSRALRLEGEDRARRWFTTTLRSIGDAVIATDPQGKVTFMNPIAEALTGYSEAESRGKPLESVFEIFSEQTRETVESPVSKVLREGAIVGLANHTLLRTKNGTEIPIDDSGAPIRNEQNELLGVVMVFRDVSDSHAERARREFLSHAGEALVASLDYQSTLSTVAKLAVPTVADWCAVELLEPESTRSYQAAVFHVDPKKLEFVRALGEKYPPDPAARTGVPEVMRTGKSEIYPEIPEALLAAAAKDAEHLKLIRTLALHSAIVVPLKSPVRTLGAMTFAYAESKRRYGPDDLAFAEDFARRAAMAIENALALRQVQEARVREHQLRADAEIASRAKDEFLAMVSHELRTPLNAILGWTVMLRAAGSPENRERGLAVIERNARAQAKLIEDVLDISRIISGKLSLSLGPTGLAEVITASVETVTPAAQAKDIEIVAHLPTQPLTFTADTQRIQQIIWNLLSNAVKFTPKSGKVTVRAAREGSEVTVEVTDTGEGIPANALPYVFDPFQQADTTTTRRHGGLGLGLAIAKQLVVAHGGVIAAHSAGVGKGSTFVVRLPARGAVIPVSAPQGIASETPTAESSLTRESLEGLRLLVVDDEEDALALVSRVLTVNGAQVHAANSAREALAMLGSLKPDVIVSDIGMPDEDGYSLVRKIRALPAEHGGKTPAIALTAYARAEDAERAFAAGYQLHISKPVDPAHLAAMVARVGGRKLDAAK